MSHSSSLPQLHGHCEMSASVVDVEGTPTTFTLGACSLLRTLFDLALSKQPSSLAAHLALTLVPSTDSHSPAALSVGRVDPSKLDSVTVREMTELVPAHFVFKLVLLTTFSCLCPSQPVTLLFDRHTTLAQLKERYLQLWWSREGREKSQASTPHRVALYISTADRNAGREVVAPDDHPFIDHWLTTGCMAPTLYVRVIVSVQPSSCAEALQAKVASASVLIEQQSSSSFQLFIQMLNGRRFTLSVESTDSIGIVKLKIRDSEQIPLDQQRLVFGGKQLQDASTLVDCGVSSGDTMHLVLKLC